MFHPSNSLPWKVKTKKFQRSWTSPKKDNKDQVLMRKNTWKEVSPFLKNKIFSNKQLIRKLFQILEKKNHPKILFLQIASTKTSSKAKVRANHNRPKDIKKAELWCLINILWMNSIKNKNKRWSNRNQLPSPIPISPLPPDTSNLSPNNSLKQESKKHPSRRTPTKESSPAVKWPPSIQGYPNSTWIQKTTFIPLKWRSTTLWT